MEILDLLAHPQISNKIFIHEKCLENENDKFQKSLSRPSIIDAKAHYWAAARRLGSIGIGHLMDREEEMQYEVSLLAWSTQAVNLD
jgi:hypothetical protein